MARKKKSGGGGGGGGDWLNTYADMVTLLLTFFILLYSMSTMDSAKFNMLVAAFASDKDSSAKIVLNGSTEGEEMTGSGAPAPEMEEEIIEDLDEIYEYLKAYMEKQDVSDSVDISKGEGYVFIKFMDDMLFEANSATLKTKDREILNFVGTAIKSVQSDAKSISIVGHTAAIPGNPDYAVSDRKLSTERANAVLIYFEDDIGIDGTKLFSQGYGKWKPFASNDTEEGRSQNRRVEILISNEGNSLSEQLDNIYERLSE